MICEYCSKPFTVDDSPNYYLLKIGEERKNISVCRTCYGDVLSLPEHVTSIKLYKITSYSYPKEASVTTVTYNRGLPAHLRKAVSTLDLVVTDSKVKKSRQKRVV
jgi:hypothetical protein